ncbi:MAG TPA: hypothetical protein VN345_00165 [Blastocatellia bacterium]|jgi:hypothetical protein|nr:hypothetical protein [Blastocatellia bacterium]
MSKRTSTCVVSLPARDVEAGISQEPSEPARVLDFRKPDVPAKSEEREKPSSDLTRNQKMRRIVESAVERMNDDQLADLITAVEKITGCFSQTGGYSE